MKKNILLVQSFLVLPLLTSSFIFTSMGPDNTTYAQTLGRGTQLPQLPQQPSLKNSGSHERRERRKERKRQQQQTLPKETTQVTSDAKNASQTNSDPDYLSPADAADAIADLAQAKESITGSSIEASERTFLLYSIRNLGDTKKILEHHVDYIEKSSLDIYYPRQKETETFEKSTLGIETEARGIGALKTITNYFKSYKQSVIGFLKNDTFEIDNQDHLAWLDKAIAECAETNDMQSLLFIAQTCEQKYPSIRFSDSSVLFTSLQEKYTKQIQASHEALEGYNQEYATKFNEESAALKEQITQSSNAHKALTLQLTQAYETKVKEEQQKIADLQKLIAGTSALLNRQDNLKKVTLSVNNPLSIPVNSVETIKTATEKRLTSLITNSNLPLIQAPTPK